MNPTRAADGEMASAKGKKYHEEKRGIFRSVGKLSIESEIKGSPVTINYSWLENMSKPTDMSIETAQKSRKFSGKYLLISLLGITRVNKYT